MHQADDLTRWEPLCRTVAADYFAPGMEAEDLLQEARIGAWKGARDFDREGGLDSTAFVAMCIRRQVITAVKAATRGKHGPLNKAITADVMSDGEIVPALDLIPASPKSEPSATLELRDQMAVFITRARERLSALEGKCLLGLVRGESYDEIGERIGVGPKAIDNAIQRARRKLGEEDDPLRRERKASDERPRMQPVTRSIDEILHDARSELLDREAKLLEVSTRTTMELKDVRRALGKLGRPKSKGKATGKATGTDNGNGRPTLSSEERRERVITALKGSLEPLSTVALADAAESNHSGFHLFLNHMKREGLVIKLAEGWGLPAKVDTETSSGALTQ